MKVLKFNISGRSAFFKDPSINKSTFLTFESIHKVAIFGIIGAIMGYQGYNNQSFEKILLQKELTNKNIELKNIDKNKELTKQEKSVKKEDLELKIKELQNQLNQKELPEFFLKLKNCEVAVIDNIEPQKKVHNYNCSSGTANCKSGNVANYIASEQWLENVNWDIFIKSDNDILLNEIYKKIISYKWTFMPYLGNNTHFCNIKNIELLEVELIENNQDMIINSIFKVDEDFEFDEDEEFEIFKYFYLPIGFNKQCHYNLSKFCKTDSITNGVKNLYKTKDNLCIQFF